MVAHKSHWTRTPVRSRRLVSTVAAGALLLGSASAFADADVQIVRTLTDPGASCPGVTDLNVSVGSQVRVCYRITNVSTAGEEVGSIKILDNAGTPDTADDFKVRSTSQSANWSGLVDLDGDGRVDDLAAGASATASVLLTYNSVGTFRGRAIVQGVALTGTPGDLQGRSFATVGVLKKSRKLKLRKTLTWPGGTCPGVKTLEGVRVGENVRYCYEVINKGDYDLNNIVVTDDMGTTGTGDDQTVSLTGLKNLDGNGANDLMPGAIARGTIIVPMPTTQIDLKAEATASANNVKDKLSSSRALVEKGQPASCQLEMKATTATDTSCSVGSKMQDVDDTQARFCYRVRNTGTTSMSNVTIKDAQFGANPFAQIPSLGAGQTSQWYSRVDTDISRTFDDHIGKVKGTINGVQVGCVGDGATALRRGSRVGANNQRGFLTRTAMLTDGNCATAQQFDDITVPKGTKVWFCYEVSHSYTGQSWPQDTVEKGGGELILIDSAIDKNDPIHEFQTSIAIGETRRFKFGPVTVNKTLHNTAYLFSPLFHRPEFQAWFYVYDASTVRVAQGDLRLTSTAPANFVNTNSSDLTTLTVRVENGGLTDADAAKVKQTFADNVEFVSANPSTGTCSYKANKRKVVCKLGTLAGGNSATVDLVVRSTDAATAYIGKSCVTSTLVESTYGDNCDTSIVFFHTGPTRLVKFWRNNQTAMSACTAQGPVNVGFATLANETFDDQGDAISLPLSGASRSVRDGDTSTAAQLASGLLNASNKSLIDGFTRTAQAQACIQGASELLAAVCNNRVFGASFGDFDIAAETSKLNKACTATTSASKLAKRINNAKKVRDAGLRFNKTGVRVQTGVGVSAAAPLNQTLDDPTDPRD